jgi:hypothetical protein
VFFVPCLCSLFFIWFYRTKTRSETKNNNNTNTTTDTHNKNKGQRPNNKYNEQCQHNFGEQKKIKKQEIIQAEWMLFLSFIVCFCCILCVAGCVLSFEFLILVLMVWYFFFFFVHFQCSCSLFHVRVLCVSFDCLKNKIRETEQNKKPQQ